MSVPGVSAAGLVTTVTGPEGHARPGRREAVNARAAEARTQVWWSQKGAMYRVNRCKESCSYFAVNVSVLNEHLIFTGPIRIPLSMPRPGRADARSPGMPRKIDQEGGVHQHEACHRSPRRAPAKR